MPESENTMYIRSNGVGSEGVKDQYADGKAAKVIKENFNKTWALLEFNIIF